MKTRTMPAGKFKAQCLTVMDEVERTHQAVVITKRGKPVAKLVPVDDEIVGSWRGRLKIVGDIVSPALSAEEWGELG